MHFSAYILGTVDAVLPVFKAKPPWCLTLRRWIGVADIYWRLFCRHQTLVSGSSSRIEGGGGNAVTNHSPSQSAKTSSLPRKHAVNYLICCRCTLGDSPTTATTRFARSREPPPCSSWRSLESRQLPDLRASFSRRMSTQWEKKKKKPYTVPRAASECHQGPLEFVLF